MKRHEKHHDESIAVYPGSFDPITKGHLNVLERALSLFDHVIVLVASNPTKETGLFAPIERMRLIRRATAHLWDDRSPYRRRPRSEWPRAGQRVWLEHQTEDGRSLEVMELFWADDEISPSQGWAELEPHRNFVTVAWLKGAATVDFCEAVGARAMIRGLRSVTDFDQEFQLAVGNMELAEQIETVFLVPRPENHFVSSSKVREIFGLRGADAVARYVPEAVLAELREKERAP